MGVLTFTCPFRFIIEQGIEVYQSRVSWMELIHKWKEERGRTPAGYERVVPFVWSTKAGLQGRVGSDTDNRLTDNMEHTGTSALFNLIIDCFEIQKAINVPLDREMDLQTDSSVVIPSTRAGWSHQIVGADLTTSYDASLRMCDHSRKRECKGGK